MKEEKEKGKEEKEEKDREIEQKKGKEKEKEKKREKVKEKEKKKDWYQAPPPGAHHLSLFAADLLLPLVAFVIVTVITNVLVSS